MAAVAVLATLSLNLVAAPPATSRPAVDAPPPAAAAAPAGDRLSDLRDLAAAKRATRAVRPVTAPPSADPHFPLSAPAARRAAPRPERTRTGLGTPRARTRTVLHHRAAAPPPDAPATGSAAGVVRFALSQVGDPYRWGAAGPSAWDCSGLVMAAYASVGVHLAHQSGAIARDRRGRRVPAGQWQPGDVIIFPGHVALYIGGGRMVEAPHAGADVRVVPLRGGRALRFL